MSRVMMNLAKLCMYVGLIGMLKHDLSCSQCLDVCSSVGGAIGISIEWYCVTSRCNITTT